MRKQYIKVIAFICVIVCFFSSFKPLSAKAMTNYSKYEVDYIFETEDGASIPQEVLQISDYEKYYFEEYTDKDDNWETINTYMLYEKDSNEPYCIGSTSGSIIFLNDDVYLMKKGICIVNQFFYIGKGDNGEDYWIYFGNDGKMIKGAIISSAFKLDKNGLFAYQQSDLYKRTFELFIQEETERARWINDGETIRKQYVSEGYTKKQIDKMIDKAVSDFVKESVRNHSPNIEDVTDILNQKKTSNLGKWVKIEDYIVEKPKFTADGHFVKNKKGQLQYWADSLVENRALLPSAAKNYRMYIEGYKYQPDNTYDWKTTVIAEKEYLNDKLVEIDGACYYFNKEGYAVKNKWVSLEEENYFDDNGKRVTNDWVAKDGEIYRVGANGSIEENCWVSEKSGNTYLSYDGTIYYGAKNKEYDIYEKILEFASRPSAGEQVGVCSKFADMLIHYLFGEKAKGTKYAYDWDKIKVGDTISGDNHIFVVMAKGKECIMAAESNENGDLMEHYGRVALDKTTLDELSKKGKMKYTFTTYYSAVARNSSDFKPQKVKLSAKTSNNTVTITLDKSEGAVGYCIYMSNSKDGDYKCIKTIKAENQLKYTIKNISDGNYYYKVRAYRNMNGKKIWGAYSSIVMCKIRNEVK